jgi:hypothetical protein
MKSTKNGTHQNNISRNSADTGAKVYANAGLTVDVDATVRSENENQNESNDESDDDLSCFNSYEA